MCRVLAFALVLGLGHTSAAVAGETLLASASRLARDAARAEAPSRTAPVSAARSTHAVVEQGQNLAGSGMSRRKKALIWLAAGVGFAATAYTIDHKVVDNTLSSLGTRKD